MKKLVVALLFTLSSMVGVSQANALLMISGTIGGVNFCATDNNVACGFGMQLTDTAGAANVINLDNQTLGGIAFTGSAQQATFGPSQNILNTSFLQATNTTGATITGSVAVSATNFLPVASTAFVSGSATYQNAIGTTSTYGWYNDPTNQQGAENPADRPGTLISTVTKNVTLISDALAHAVGPIAVNDPTLFSMTLSNDFSLVAGGTIVGNSSTEIKPFVAAANVPEPATLVLFGSGLAALAARRRRNKQ